ncbi:hypothetical protein ACRHQS_03805 [Burkholderia pseudomallei]|uniref:hypothetical protein n=1 Tax=Burkholderia pseudomallei TaxID=28450 RepID=UPI004062F040
MAKQSNAPTAQTKQAQGGAGDGKDVDLNTGAASKLPEGDRKMPADAGAPPKLPVDDAAKQDGAATASRAPVAGLDFAAEGGDKTVASMFIATTLAGHVSNLLTSAETAGDTASQSVMNRIHVKLAEFRHMLTSIEQHVLDAAHADVQELADDMKRLF